MRIKMLHTIYQKQVEAWKERFGDFIYNKFDATGKKAENETHSWFFCNDLVDGQEISDCACCIDGAESSNCGCVCHKRLAQLKSFISSSHHKDTIELIEAEIERKRGMRKEYGENWNGVDESYEIGELHGYNSAIDEDISYLEEQLKLIKKEI